MNYDADFDIADYISDQIIKENTREVLANEMLLGGGIECFSLELAATWLAIGELGGPEELGETSPWGWHEQALPENIKKQAGIYLKWLIVDIKAERIKPKLIRFIFLSDDVDTKRTLLDMETLDRWLALHGVTDHGIHTLWGDTLQWDVIEMHEAVQLATINAIKRVRHPEAYAHAEQEAGKLTSGAIVELIAQNQKLKADLRKKPNNESPKNSALLLIARALEIYQQGDPMRYTQDRFINDVIGDENIHGLGDRSIKGLLAEAKKLLKDRRKE